MSNLVNPLQLIVSQAAKLLPTGETDKYAQRLKNTNPTDPSLILIDVSGSMDETVENGRRKIDILRDALNRPVAEREIVITFSNTCERIYNFQSIPEPSGNTDLESALSLSIAYNPRHTIVISDGKPDNTEFALVEAAKLSGIISTLYIGRDDDHNAIAFMAKLARLGCGTSQVCDITQPQNQLLLKERIAALLPSK